MSIEILYTIKQLVDYPLSPTGRLANESIPKYEAYDHKSHKAPNE